MATSIGPAPFLCLNRVTSFVFGPLLYPFIVCVPPNKPTSRGPRGWTHHNLSTAAHRVVLLAVGSTARARARFTGCFERVRPAAAFHLVLVVAVAFGAPRGQDQGCGWRLVGALGGAAMARDRSNAPQRPGEILRRPDRAAMMPAAATANGAAGDSQCRINQIPNPAHRPTRGAAGRRRVLLRAAAAPGPLAVCIVSRSGDERGGGARWDPHGREQAALCMATSGGRRHDLSPIHPARPTPSADDAVAFTYSTTQQCRDRCYPTLHWHIAAAM